MKCTKTLLIQVSYDPYRKPLRRDVFTVTIIAHSTTDLDDEDYDLSETSIQNWIVKLPKAKFNLVRTTTLPNLVCYRPLTAVLSCVICTGFSTVSLAVKTSQRGRKRLQLDSARVQHRTHHLPPHQ